MLKAKAAAPASPAEAAAMTAIAALLERVCGRAAVENGCADGWFGQRKRSGRGREAGRSAVRGAEARDGPSIVERESLLETGRQASAESGRAAQRTAGAGRQPKHPARGGRGGRPPRAPEDYQLNYSEQDEIVLRIMFASCLTVRIRTRAV